MNAATNLPDWDRTLSQSDTATTGAARMLQQVMKETASFNTLPQLDQNMRFHGPNLVKALEELARSGKAGPSPRSLEDRLTERGVRQNILDNLELSRLHFRRGTLLIEHLFRQKDEVAFPENAKTRIQEWVKAYWEHLFGLTFLSFIAAGLIDEDEPGVDIMLAWMRHRSRQAYVHAAAADEFLRAA